ncbi:MAG TPA: LytTR family DNA-binding domain-containing protein [Ignavibacteriaceae bacterium]|nr:LytTR family DNA-binding domain-containing protein [Ignavibacteriaceae bacterium]
MNQKKIKNFIDYFSKPYALLDDNRIKIIYSIGGSLFILFFLWAFGPFGIALFKDIDKLKFLSLICLSGAVILIIHLYLLQNIIIKKHTIRTTIIWLSWMTLIVGLSNFIIYMAYFENGRLNWKGFPTILFQTFLVGLLPVLFITVLYNSYILKKNIKTINQINADLSIYQAAVSDKSYLTLSAKNLREVITVDLNSLLYIASADNYVEIHWLDKGHVQKTLLRKTLKEIEKEVKNQFQHIERCHNSYIVNINKIKSIIGNSGGYRIVLNAIESPIPVSRKYQSSFFKRLKK